MSSLTNKVDDWISELPNWVILILVCLLVCLELAGILLWTLAAIGWTAFAVCKVSGVM